MRRKRIVLLAKSETMSRTQLAMTAFIIFSLKSGETQVVVRYSMSLIIQ